MTTLVAFGSASAARADERIVAKVPFPFIVGTVRLLAGDYIVRQDISEGDGVLSIESADGRQQVHVLTIPASSDQPPAQPELVFRKLDTDYFLARVVPPDGDERDLVLTPAIMERERADAEPASR